MGVQVVGAFRDDLVLLDLAAKLEEALDQPDS
jgi:Asp-tRNA(Asn)/Glu-tRNA(Gln) amidotransferase A subunit family amidase